MTAASPARSSVLGNRRNHQQRLQPSATGYSPILVELCSGIGACPEQQDAMCARTDVFQKYAFRSCRTIDAGPVLLAVADGVATSPGAARASRLALKYLVESLRRAPPDSCDGLLTGRYLRSVQQRLASTLSKTPSTYGASTTIVVAHIVGADLAVLNVGDSRCYLRTAAGAVRQISHDHTQMDSLRAEMSCRSNVEYASIYGALTDCLVADAFEDDFSIHRSTARLSQGDRVVLCSDGIHDTLGDEETMRRIADAASASDMVDGMRDAVLSAGAPDNFSIMTATIGRVTAGTYR